MSNQPHWSVYTCPPVNDPEQDCDFVATSTNWNYIWARACHEKLIHSNLRVFIRWTPVKPFDQFVRLLEGVCHLEVLSLFTESFDLQIRPSNFYNFDNEKDFPF